MNTANGNINQNGVSNLQDLLDAVPADRTVACLPTHEFLLLYDGEKELGRIPIEGVFDVLLIDDSSIRKNYTIGRTLLLGPLVLLFPKRTFHESYRLCIQWKDQKGDCRFTYIHIASRIMADHMLNAVKRSLQAENRVELAQKLPKANERGAIVKAEQYKRHTEVSPFITCSYCTVEFRKTDLPPDGKCPVCGQAFKG